MKNSNKLLIKIGLIFISLCFLCITLCSNNVLALSLKKGYTVTTGTELWDKTKTPAGETVYCIQPGTSFKSGNFKVQNIWEIYYENGECKVKLNGTEYTGSAIAQVIAKGYIFAENDPHEKTRLANGFAICSNWDSNSQRSIKQGIYNVLSYKQEALWMTQLGETEDAKKKWFWEDGGAKLVYHWDLDSDGKTETLRY